MLVNREGREFGDRRDGLLGQIVDVLPPDAVHADSPDASGGGPDQIRVRPLRTAEGAFVLRPVSARSDQTPADWQQTYPGDDDDSEPAIITRQWVIWHLIEHDLHHGGEISLTLGMHGLPAPNL